MATDPKTEHQQKVESELREAYTGFYLRGLEAALDMAKFAEQYNISPIVAIEGLIERNRI